MCLIVKDGIKLGKINSEGFHIGWELITKDNLPVFMPMPVNLSYKIGENISNRSERCSPNDIINGTKFYIFENMGGRIRIDFGYHLCLTRKEARAIRHVGRPSQDRKTGKVIKVYYKPEDIIATGVWGDDGITKSVVVDKLTIKSLKGE